MKKYYAVRKGHHPGIICGEWAEVEPRIKAEISKFRCPEWKGFPTRDQAEAYMAQGDTGWAEAEGQTGGADQSQEDALVASFQFTADAVIFVDGSRNFDREDFDHEKPNRTCNKEEDFYFASYGIIIFFRDGSVYVESARIEDGTPRWPEECYFTTTRHGFSLHGDGTISPVEEQTQRTPYRQWRGDRPPVEFSDRYVLAGWNVVGETEGARRALDLCLHERGLNSAYVFFDCEQVDIVKKIYRGKNPQLMANVTRHYGDFCTQLRDEGKDVGTMHIYSHGKGKARGFQYDWRLEWLNFCTDVLAKAETYNKAMDAIRGTIPQGVDSTTAFTAEVDPADGLETAERQRRIAVRRRDAYALVKKTLEDPRIRPEFI